MHDVLTNSSLELVVVAESTRKTAKEHEIKDDKK